MEKQLSPEELQSFISDLESKDMTVKGGCVEFMAKEAIPDQRLLPYLKELLTDTSYIIISIPYVYAETRYAAAYAIANIYEALGINESIELTGVPIPISEGNGFGIDHSLPDDITKISKGIDPVEAALRTMELLRDLGRFPLVNITINPGDHMITEMKKEWGLPHNWRWTEK
jgi:hypothetical protein